MSLKQSVKVAEACISQNVRNFYNRRVGIFQQLAGLVHLYIFKIFNHRFACVFLELLNYNRRRKSGKQINIVCRAAAIFGRVYFVKYIGKPSRTVKP